MVKVVSIILPTFNRADILAETLDSIMAQTYAFWECIVVDDESSDSTVDLLALYCKKEPRIKFFRRPKGKLKGANACRNFGFEKSKGEFIIWFDSDDLMTPDHVEKKISFLNNCEKDFVVAKTQNFNINGFEEPYHYEIKPYGIRASDFILLKIHWYTYDVMIRREVAEKISWNEKMKSWQDYNYFCKMLLVSESGAYLDKVLTHRRLHGNSIQDNLHRNKSIFASQMLENRWYTFLDIKNKVDAPVKKELLNGIMNLCFELSSLRKFSFFMPQIIKMVRLELGYIAALALVIGLTTSFTFKKGEYFLRTAKGKSFF